VAARQGRRADATSIDASIFQELTESITEVAPWADPAVLTKNAKALTLDAKLADVPAVVPIRISPFLLMFGGFVTSRIKAADLHGVRRAPAPRWSPRQFNRLVR
jgi:hypothetical protein